MYKLKSIAKSEKNNRKENEDAIYNNDKLGLYIIADGMEGKNGKIASNFCINFLSDKIKKRKYFHKITAETIENLIQDCNRELVMLGQQQKKEYGSTLDVVWYDNDDFYVFHIGDSRVYGTRNNLLKQLTIDDTIGTEKYAEGHLNDKQLAVNKFNRDSLVYKEIYEVVTNGIGMLKDVSVAKYPVSKYNTVILVTDGITDLVLDSELESIVRNVDSIEQAADLVMRVVKNPKGMIGFNMKYNYFKLNDMLDSLKKASIESKEFDALLNEVNKVETRYQKAKIIQYFCKKYPNIHKIFSTKFEEQIIRDNASIIITQSEEVHDGWKRFFRK